ncbi:hypothetical protein RB196_33085 [Streptomyces sp. PmtA]|uniref:hypothetical protein n=1 Tax=Streptomyces sp. PmtA TaxID=3074275 RepID=UPI003014A775
MSSPSSVITGGSPLRWTHEPPTAAQINTIIRSALHQADGRAFAEVAARLARAEGVSRRLDTLVFTDPTGDQAKQGDAAAPAHTTRPPRYVVPARGPIFDLKATGGLPVTWFAARQRHPK